MYREIRLASVPKRIISLVPSQTEFLLDLGLTVEVVGITKFCIHPAEQCAEITKIGGTKIVNIEKVKALQPDIIIGNKEENTEADIRALEQIAPVWMSDIATLEDALDMMMQLSVVLDKVQEGTAICSKIATSFNLDVPSIPTKKVAYLIWKKPYMLAGKHTFIDDLLHKMGLENFTQENRYPIWEIQETADLDYIFLSSEPYPFKAEDVAFFQAQFPNAHVKIVDGELFSWYGSRLQYSASYFKELLSELTL